MNQFQDRDQEQAQSASTLDTPLTGGQQRAQETIAEELRTHIYQPGTEGAPELRSDVYTNFEELADTLGLYAAGHKDSAAVAAIQAEVRALSEATADYIEDMKEHFQATLPVVYFIRDFEKVVDRDNPVEERVLDTIKDVMKNLGRTAFEYDPKYYDTLKDALEDFKLEIANRADSLDFDGTFQRLDSLRTSAESLAVTRVDVKTSQDETLRAIDSLLKAEAE